MISMKFSCCQVFFRAMEYFFVCFQHLFLLIAAKEINFYAEILFLAHNAVRIFHAARLAIGLNFYENAVKKKIDNCIFDVIIKQNKETVFSILIQK